LPSSDGDWQRDWRRLRSGGLGGLVPFWLRLSPKIANFNQGRLSFLRADALRTRLCDGLQPCGNVHAVSEQVSSPHHHFADVHANTEADATVGCDPRVRFGQGSLRIHRALYGINSASELRKDTVARRVRYPAPVLPNEPVEDCASFGQALEGADLISAHEAAVALDICCEDRDEASADFRRV
jgi:hypothetical protein